jgi:type III secretion protein L
MKSIIKAKLLNEEEPYYLLPKTNADLKIVKSNLEVESTNVEVGFTEAEVLNLPIESIKEPAKESELNDNKAAHEYEQINFEELKEVAYQEAYSRGLSDIKDKYDHLFTKAHSVVDGIKAAIPEYVKKNELIIASIVYEAVSKIIGTTLVDKDKSLEVVANIVGGLERNLIQQVYISPKDFESLKELQELSSLDNVGVGLSSVLELLKMDGNIKLGGCRVVLRDGSVDASIDSQLHMLKSSLANKANE